MPVGRLLAEMSSTEFAEWAVYLDMKHKEAEKAAKQRKR